MEGMHGTSHSYTSESDKSRRGITKELFYESGDDPIKSRQFREDCRKKGVKVINIQALTNSFVYAIKKFNDYLDGNPRKANLVYKRADKFFGISGDYSNIPRG